MTGIIVSLVVVVGAVALLIARSRQGWATPDEMHERQMQRLAEREQAKQGGSKQPFDWHGWFALAFFGAVVVIFVYGLVSWLSSPSGTDEWCDDVNEIYSSNPNMEFEDWGDEDSRREFLQKCEY